MSPSTYNYYERGRIPPIPTLLRVSEVTGVDLNWLLTGMLPPGQSSGEVSPKHARLVARLGDLLRRREEAGAALNAFIDLLESQAEVASRAAKENAERPAGGETPLPPTRVPVLGRTAAGVPHFWKSPRQSVDLFQTAVARGTGSSESRSATLLGPEDPASTDANQPVLLVQLSRPVRVGELNIAEFLDCPRLADRWPDAFALRIDGDSMHPSLSHGDLVILSPRESARPGHAAVVQLRNQIGVTCKLFYTDKTHVRLIPINEQLQATNHPLKDLVWALAVLYRVRFSGSPSGDAETEKRGR